MPDDVHCSMQSGEATELADLAKLRQQRATAPFALDRMLPFWALVFNLRDVARDLNQLASTLPQLE